MKKKIYIVSAVIVVLVGVIVSSIIWVPKITHPDTSTYSQLTSQESNEQDKRITSAHLASFYKMDFSESAASSLPLTEIMPWPTPTAQTQGVLDMLNAYNEQTHDQFRKDVNQDIWGDVQIRNQHATSSQIDQWASVYYWPPNHKLTVADIDLSKSFELAGAVQAIYYSDTKSSSSNASTSQ